MQRDNRRLGSFPIGWVRPSRCTGWVKSPGYNLPPWTTPSKAGPETGREPNRPREGTPARPAAGPPGGRARGMEDGESRMENRGWSARFARWTVSRESYIVSRGAVGTRASTLVSASAPTSPHLAVSPGTTSSSLPLIDSSAPTTTRPPSHRHEHPLHPSTTNPPHPLFLSFSLWRRDARTGASTLVSAPHPHSPRLAGDLAAVLDLVHRQIDTEAHRAFIDRLG